MRTTPIVQLVLWLALATPASALVRAKEPAEPADVSFQQGEGSLQILLDGQPIAEYVVGDDQTTRPYFQHLRTPSGVQVTRNRPPVKGKDLDDHPTMHPGLWLAFGDLDGADFWRNKARVRHIRYVKEPEGGAGRASFTVENAYEADGRTICTEICTITISVRPHGYLLDWKSTFTSEEGDFTFGDQEEMGLGVRVATPLAVVKGGTITDSEGRKNEPQIWGKKADWCQYGGTLDEKHVGVVLMPSPKNFRRCWFHARDYGLLAANAFGRNAFTKGEKSRLTVEKGEKFRLGFGVFVYEVSAGESPDVAGAYRDYVKE